MIAAAKNDFYVYALYRENGVPFYIGKGRRNRIDRHERDVRAGRSRKDNIIVGMQRRGVELPKLKLEVNLTDREACNFEKAFIAAIGRHPEGPLVNVTGGGEGFQNITAEANAKRRAALTGKPKSREHVAKVAAALAGRKNPPRSPEIRAAISRSLTGRKKTLEHVQKVRLGSLGLKRSPEVKEKLRQAQLKINAARRQRSGDEK